MSYFEMELRMKSDCQHGNTGCFEDSYITLVKLRDITNLIKYMKR